MTWLRDFRAYRHPLLLIAVWSAVEAAAIAWTALVPDWPFHSESGTGSIGGAIFWTGLLVLFLGLGSRLAWWLAIFSNTVAVVVCVAAGAFDRSVKPLGLAALEAF